MISSLVVMDIKWCNYRFTVLPRAIVDVDDVNFSKKMFFVCN